MFGERLKNLRLEKKLTQKELGANLSLAESTISLYESAKREPDFETVKKIAAFFGVSTDYLLSGKTINGSKLDFSPLENFIKEYEGLSSDDQEKAMKELFNRIVEGKKGKR